MHDEGGDLASDFAGDAAAGTRARTAEALREELGLERRQRLEDVRRERSKRLEAQRRAERLELEETYRRAERLEFALWEAQQEARRLREELEAERSKGFWRRLFGDR